MQISGLHIEPTNICTLKCSGCARTRFIEQWPQHWKNHSVDPDQLDNFLDVDLTDKRVSLCGNYGDPIYHPQLRDLIRCLKHKGASISIITNGSHRSVEWWTDLCQQLDTRDRVVFSIDGSPQTFQSYRVNADWPTIHQAILTCVAHGVATAWKFIPFAFNQHEIEACKILSQELGMKDFFIELSDRFDERTQHLMPDTSLLGGRWTFTQQFKSGKSGDIRVDPKCWNHDRHFITAEGFYSPCCWIADHRFYYQTFWGKDRNLYRIEMTTISQIFGQPKVMQFFQDIPNQVPNACRYNCPASG
jgi:hypothetical protein